MYTECSARFDKSNPILFADATSFIITNWNKAEFKHNIDDIFREINKWFWCNLLSLNYGKTTLLQFVNKTNQEIDMQISFNNKKITNTQSIKFLGLTSDASLTWEYDINELTTRLNKACFAIGSIRPFMSLDVLRSTYFSYVHSVISYGIIFWGNSSCSKDIFKVQKRIIRVITNSRICDSCRELFKQLDILPLQSQYIYSLLVFINKNKDEFPLNSQVHRIDTRQNSNLHLPSANLRVDQRGVCCAGIKIYNHLPTDIKNLSNDKNKFKLALKRFLLCNYFYSWRNILINKILLSWFYI
jgi:hypothetical protein